MKRIIVTALLAILSIHAPAALHATDASRPPGKPNIVLIMSDDVGIGDIGCCGGPFKTPHIDALAKNGLRFAQCYSTPLCGPSRCQILTGRYPFRTGLISNQSQNAVDPGREVMIPTVMKKAGYVTASAGKWGQICLGPGEWGFDEYLVFKGSGRYWHMQTPSYTVNGQQKNLPPGVYLPDIMHQFAADFLAKHREQPFFLYYPMSHIHGPIVRTPDSKPGAGKDELYAGNVAYMDKLVGRLMDELDRLGLREKTLVIFSGDNGTARFGMNIATVNGRHISGQKATMIEGGSRVPLIANWKGVTPAGKVLDDLIDFSDFFATFTEFGGATPPKDVTLDSHSFAPQLRGEKGMPRDWIYVELNGKSYVRDVRYKLTNAGRLFDLKNAPFEEIAIPDDTANAGAIAARKKLQEILNQHPAATGKELAPNAGKKGNKRRKQRPPR